MPSRQESLNVENPADCREDGRVDAAANPNRTHQPDQPRRQVALSFLAVDKAAHIHAPQLRSERCLPAINEGNTTFFEEVTGEVMEVILGGVPPCPRGSDWRRFGQFDLLFDPLLNDDAALAITRIEANADALVPLPPHYGVQLKSQSRG